MCAIQVRKNLPRCVAGMLEPNKACHILRRSHRSLRFASLMGPMAAVTFFEGGPESCQKRLDAKERQ